MFFLRKIAKIPIKKIMHKNDNHSTQKMKIKLQKNIF
jgi:hypothetical protein